MVAIAETGADGVEGNAVEEAGDEAVAHERTRVCQGKIEVSALLHPRRPRNDTRFIDAFVCVRDRGDEGRSQALENAPREEGPSMGRASIWLGLDTAASIRRASFDAQRRGMDVLQHVRRVDDSHGGVKLGAC